MLITSESILRHILTTFLLGVLMGNVITKDMTCVFIRHTLSWFRVMFCRRFSFVVRGDDPSDP